MKKLFILQIIILVVFFIFAVSALADQSIPNHIENIIKQNAKIEYPNDYKTQLYIIKRETEAYMALQNYKPNDIYCLTLDEIKTIAEKQYPEKYSTQLYSVKKDVEAYRQIENYNVSDVGISWAVFLKIKENAQVKYPGQYSMQLSEIKRQIQAYLKINR